LRISEQWDRQPFYVTNDPTTGAPSLPVPDVSEISQNLIFADYQGAKALDHDDGSSFFDDHSNVIFMGWGQKTFLPAPGAKKTRNSLILFTSSVLTEHGGEKLVEYAEEFFNNTVVMTGGSYGKIDKCDPKFMKVHDNRIFANGADTFKFSCGGKSLTLAEMQKQGFETGSTLSAEIPKDDILIAQAKQLLGFVEA
jgi:hypothetical protein